jgi:hypothetical protein
MSYIRSRLPADVTLSASLVAELKCALEIAVSVCVIYGADTAANLLRESANNFDDAVRDADEKAEAA